MQAVLVVLPIFLLIGFGWFLGRRGFISPQTAKENNDLLYHFAMPAVLLNGILGAKMQDIPSAGRFALAVCLPYLATTVLLWIFARRGEDPRRFAALTLSATRGNHFFAGLPIVTLAMGREGLEAGAMILAFSMAFMQLITIGSGQLALLGRVTADSLKRTMLQLLKNPLFMSCILALILIFLKLDRLPSWMAMTLKIMADISTGLALLMLGTRIDMRGLLPAFRTTWKLQLFKVLIHPLVAWLILLHFGLPQIYVQAGTLIAAMPEAVNTTIIAQGMGMDSDYCAMGTTVSVVLAMITLPIGILLLGAIR